MAARKLGMTSVPVVELADLTPDQRRAYVQPNSRRLRQIASTWASLWVRGFYAYGTRSAIARIGWVGSRAITIERLRELVGKSRTMPVRLRPCHTFAKADALSTKMTTANSRVG
jgi:hypothetical protein